MGAKYFALILGIVYLVVGILGFVPGINDMAHAGMAVQRGAGGSSLKHSSALSNGPAAAAQGLASFVRKE